MSFVLNPQLQASSIEIGNFPLCKVLLKNHADYPWCILVPKVMGVSEIYELERTCQLQLIEEISCVSSIMKDYFQPHKINIASLGNIVSQLHIHVVARFGGDPLWPHGIWQEAQIAKDYPQEKFEKLCQDLQRSVEIAFSKQ